MRALKMKSLSNHKTQSRSSGMAFLPSKLADKKGFVLLSVLLVTTVVSAFALGAAIIARIHLRDANMELHAIAARALADAGLTRIIAALETSEDPLLASLRTSPTPWSYAGTELLLELESEAGKVDLNSSDGELVQSIIRAVIKERFLADRILKRWMELRRRGHEIEAIDALLDTQEKFTGIATDLERHFTTTSGARGIDPIAAPDLVLRHVPGISEEDLRQITIMRQGVIDRDALFAIRRRYQPLLDGERPLYRIRSTISLPHQLIIRREALVAQDDGTGKVHVIFWRDRVEYRAPAASSK